MACRHRGFTMLELLMVAMFLALTLISLLSVVSSANQSAMDAWYKSLAVSLCREPIEVLRGMGYAFVADYARHPLPEYPLGWSSIPAGNGAGGAGWYPAEARDFQREVVITPADNPGSGVRAMQIKVTVTPAGDSKISRWLRRQSVSLEALVVAPR